MADNDKPENSPTLSKRSLKRDASWIRKPKDDLTCSPTEVKAKLPLVKQNSFVMMQAKLFEPQVTTKEQESKDQGQVENASSDKSDESKTESEISMNQNIAQLAEAKDEEKEMVTPPLDDSKTNEEEVAIDINTKTSDSALPEETQESIGGATKIDFEPLFNVLVEKTFISDSTQSVNDSSSVTCAAKTVVTSDESKSDSAAAPQLTPKPLDAAAEENVELKLENETECTQKLTTEDVIKLTLSAHQTETTSQSNTNTEAEICTDTIQAPDEGTTAPAGGQSVIDSSCELVAREAGINSAQSEGGFAVSVNKAEEVVIMGVLNGDAAFEQKVETTLKGVTKCTSETNSVVGGQLIVGAFTNTALSEQELKHSSGASYQTDLQSPPEVSTGAEAKQSDAFPESASSNGLEMPVSESGNYEKLSSALPVVVETETNTKAPPAQNADIDQTVAPKHQQATEAKVKLGVSEVVEPVPATQTSMEILSTSQKEEAIIVVAAKTEIDKQLGICNAAKLEPANAASSLVSTQSDMDSLAEASAPKCSLNLTKSEENSAAPQDPRSVITSQAKAVAEVQNIVVEEKGEQACKDAADHALQIIVADYIVLQNSLSYTTKSIVTESESRKRSDATCLIDLKSIPDIPITTSATPADDDTLTGTKQPVRNDAFESSVIDEEEIYIQGHPASDSCIGKNVESKPTGDTAPPANLGSVLDDVFDFAFGTLLSMSASKAAPNPDPEVGAEAGMVSEVQTTDKAADQNTETTLMVHSDSTVQVSANDESACQEIANLCLKTASSEEILRGSEDDVQIDSKNLPLVNVSESESPVLKPEEHRDNVSTLQGSVYATQTEKKVVTDVLSTNSVTIEQNNKSSIESLHEDTNVLPIVSAQEPGQNNDSANQFGREIIEDETENKIVTVTRSETKLKSTEDMLPLVGTRSDLDSMLESACDTLIVMSVQRESPSKEAPNPVSEIKAEIGVVANVQTADLDPEQNVETILMSSVKNDNGPQNIDNPNLKTDVIQELPEESKGTSQIDLMEPPEFPVSGSAALVVIPEDHKGNVIPSQGCVSATQIEGRVVNVAQSTNIAALADVEARPKIHIDTEPQPLKEKTLTTIEKTVFDSVNTSTDDKTVVKSEGTEDSAAQPDPVSWTSLEIRGVSEVQFSGTPVEQNSDTTFIAAPNQPVWMTVGDNNGSQMIVDSDPRIAVIQELPEEGKGAGQINLMEPRLVPVALPELPVVKPEEHRDNVTPPKCHFSVNQTSDRALNAAPSTDNTAQANVETQPKINNDTISGPAKESTSVTGAHPLPDSSNMTTDDKSVVKSAEGIEESAAQPGSVSWIRAKIGATSEVLTVVTAAEQNAETPSLSTSNPSPHGSARDDSGPQIIGDPPPEMAVTQELIEENNGTGQTDIIDPHGVPVDVPESPVVEPEVYNDNVPNREGHVSVTQNEKEVIHTAQSTDNAAQANVETQTKIYNDTRPGEVQEITLTTIASPIPHTVNTPTNDKIVKSAESMEDSAAQLDTVSWIRAKIGVVSEVLTAATAVEQNTETSSLSTLDQPPQVNAKDDSGPQIIGDPHPETTLTQGLPEESKGTSQAEAIDLPDVPARVSESPVVNSKVHKDIVATSEGLVSVTQTEERVVNIAQPTDKAALADVEMHPKIYSDTKPEPVEKMTLTTVAQPVRDSVNMSTEGKTVVKSAEGTQDSEAQPDPVSKTRIEIGVVSEIQFVNPAVEQNSHTTLITAPNQSSLVTTGDNNGSQMIADPDPRTATTQDPPEESRGAGQINSMEPSLVPVALPESPVVKPEEHKDNATPPDDHVSLTQPSERVVNVDLSTDISALANMDTQPKINNGSKPGQAEEMTSTTGAHAVPYSVNMPTDDKPLAKSADDLQDSAAQPDSVSWIKAEIGEVSDALTVVTAVEQNAEIPPLSTPHVSPQASAKDDSGPQIIDDPNIETAATQAKGKESKTTGHIDLMEPTEFPVSVAESPVVRPVGHKGVATLSQSLVSMTQTKERVVNAAQSTDKTALADVGMQPKIVVKSGERTEDSVAQPEPVSATRTEIGIASEVQFADPAIEQTSAPNQSACVTAGDNNGPQMIVDPNPRTATAQEVLEKSAGTSRINLTEPTLVFVALAESPVVKPEEHKDDVIPPEGHVSVTQTSEGAFNASQSTNKSAQTNVETQPKINNDTSPEEMTSTTSGHPVPDSVNISTSDKTVKSAQEKQDAQGEKDSVAPTNQVSEIMVEKGVAPEVQTVDPAGERTAYTTPEADAGQTVQNDSDSQTIAHTNPLTAQSKQMPEESKDPSQVAFEPLPDVHVAASESPVVMSEVREEDFTPPQDLFTENHAMNDVQSTDKAIVSSIKSQTESSLHTNLDDCVKQLPGEATDTNMSSLDKNAKEINKSAPQLQTKQTPETSGDCKGDPGDERTLSGSIRSALDSLFDSPGTSGDSSAERLELDLEVRCTNEVQTVHSTSVEQKATLPCEGGPDESVRVSEESSHQPEPKTNLSILSQRLFELDDALDLEAFAADSTPKSTKLVALSISSESSWRQHRRIPQRLDIDICFYCDSAIDGNTKLVFSEPPIICHPECLKCGVCTRGLGDLQIAIFLRKEVFHCNECYRNADNCA